ncbi:hypothetical protein OTU49_010372, partial [Cherax quadricarinatus]
RAELQQQPRASLQQQPRASLQQQPRASLQQQPRASLQQQPRPDEFWGRLARSRLEWQKEFQVVRDHDMEKSAFRWFPDGQLNVSVNCVDRHARQHPDRVALLWEKDEPGQEERVTYR